MNLTRCGFLAGATAALAAPAIAASAILPAVYEGGRFFATPRLARDGSVMKLWLDTDGGGFVFSEAVARFGLAEVPDPKSASRRWTRLPAFAGDASIPPPLGRDGRIAVFVRDDEARNDPILQGFDGQLGASWFQGRVWTFDYRTNRVLLRDALTAEDGATVPVRFAIGPDGKRVDGGQYPRIDVTAGERTVAMSFDIAASIVVNEAARLRFDADLPVLRATSFVRSSLLDAWRREHPEWAYLGDVGPRPGFAAIRVASVRLGATDLGPVWFTTRPGDDVFDGDAGIGAKLGAPAFFGRVVSLDYPQGLLALR